MMAEKMKYEMSLQRSASAPETIVTADDANATASRNKPISCGLVSASRRKKNCMRIGCVALAPLAQDM